MVVKSSKEQIIEDPAGLIELDC